MTEDFLQPVSDLTNIAPGTILRRTAPDRTQQGGFRGLNETGDAAIVAEVVTMHTPGFVAEVGLVRPGPEDKLHVLTDTFGSGDDQQALLVLQEWVLFREHASLQADMLQFMRTSYSPRQILFLKTRDLLAHLFVPLQQRFKIGKFKEKVDWVAVAAERFKQHLDTLEDGAHITYVAFIPKDTSGLPRFYSVGTKPHLETLARLKREPFGFPPNHGGHIKVVSEVGETPRRFVVDAGSNDLGSGSYTALAVAQFVTDALAQIYPGAEYVPLAGRGAHGLHQSY